MTQSRIPELFAQDVNPDRMRAARQTTDLQHNVQNRIKREKELLLRDWISGGGTEADFEEIWPAIHAQLGRIRVMEIGEKARSRSLTTFRKGA